MPIEYDEVKVILDLIEDNWTSANTDAKTPTFMKIIDAKVYPNNYGNYDIIYFYQLDNTVSSFALGRIDKEISTVIIDIRSDGNGITDKHAHLIKLREEVKRILRANYISATAIGKYDTIQITSDSDKSDKMKQLFRCLINVEMTANVVS